MLDSFGVTNVGNEIVYVHKVLLLWRSVVRSWFVMRWLVALSVILVFACSEGPGSNNNDNTGTPDSGTSAGVEPTSPGPEPSAGSEPGPEPSTGPESALDASTGPEDGPLDTSTNGPEPGPEPVEQPDTNQGQPDTSPGPEPTPGPEAGPEPPPTPQGIRFILMGDTGTGSAQQKAVATAIKKKCDAEAQPGGRGPCDFGLLLGDNFYDVGVSSAKDPQFKTKFSDIYSFLKFPFYITIGNHDYGIDKIGGVGAGFHKFQYYRDYAKTNPQFVFPNKYFSFKKGNATFVSLNTCEIFFDGLPGVDVKAQKKFVQQELAKATQNQSVWKFAFGHHPYISNGTHGDAGKYEGIPFIPFVSGDSVKKFMESEICGKFDFYFSGHDHNMQLLQSKCNTNWLVHGAGAKTKKAGDTKRNKVWFQNFQDTGFAYVHISGRTMTIEFYTATSAQPVFSKTYTK
ncbi:MAG: hypothetical protein EP343_20510 [Deltaproteobacteria bacterium]|nr:MAG: hypothetical protein EP343_20510 [Deltaproteobacteria bacterium]